MRILVLVVVGVTLAFASAANSGAAWAQAPSACQPVIWLGTGVQPPQWAGQAGNFAVQPGRAFPIQAGGTVKITWGQTYTVAQNYNAQIRAAQKAGCGIFHTILGPGSDGYHESHIHFDVAHHGGQDYCH